MLLILVLLWTSIGQVIWIVTNVTSAIVIRSSGHEGIWIVTNVTSAIVILVILHEAVRIGW